MGPSAACLRQPLRTGFDELSPNGVFKLKYRLQRKGRVDGAAPVYAGRFRGVAASGIDAVSGTDGIDALGGPVGPFPEGVVAVQDDDNEGRPQNFKLIDWREIRNALGLQK